MKVGQEVYIVPYDSRYNPFYYQIKQKLNKENKRKNITEYHLFVVYLYSVILKLIGNGRKENN